MTRVNPVVQQATPSDDSTQRHSTKTRIGVSSLLGGSLALGAGVAAHKFGGVNVPAVAVTVAEKVADFLTSNLPADILTKIQTFATTHAPTATVVSTGGAAVALGTAFAAGSLVGAATGKFTAHKVSLNDVKASLGVAGSDLNFGQIHRVADIAVDGGIFAGRSTVVEFKDDAARIKNLNKELTKTEFSLSSNAHNTSKARGTEDRFFDFEGGRLSGIASTTGGFADALASIKSAINSEVKATDKYTFQQGNSSTSINRREYILAGIMGYAHQRGIAGNYLAAAVKERAELAETNPKLADANFRKALQDAIASGILAPNTDSKCYEAMVNAAALASSLTPEGKNPDSAISSIFDSLKDAGLIDRKHKARFFDDVRKRLGNPDAEIVDPTQGEHSGSASAAPGLSPVSDWFDKLIGKLTPQESQTRTSLDDGLNGPVVETDAQRKARLAAEAEGEATATVNQYAETLAQLDPRQKELADLYEKLIRLLSEKAIPLDQITEMGEGKLLGVLAMRHRHGFDIFEKYEANDAAIAETREEIGVLSNEINASAPARPENFDLASKEQRKAAEAVLDQVNAESQRIVSLKTKAEKISAKIDDVENKLEDSEGKANEFLFREKEAGFDEPTRPQEPGFFEKLFSNFGSSKVEDTEETLEVEESIEGDQGFDAPVTVQQEEVQETELAEPEAQATQGVDGLPDPVIEETRSWKFWS